MIQRIQTIWLLLAAVCAVLMFIWPLYGGTMPGGELKLYMANTNFTPMLVTGLVALLSFSAIFMFKKRSTQMKLVWMAILLSIALAVVTYVFTSQFAAANNFTSGGYRFTTVFPILIFIFLVLALRGIIADHKLVKSVDRLR